MTRAEIGDTVLVHSAVPRFVDTATFVLTRSWGTFDGPVEEEFVSIRGFAVSGAGDVYVFSSGVGLLHFDGDGRYVGKIAGVGEGPAEVGCAHHLAVSGDTVAVLDPCNQRLSLFSPGQPPRSWRTSVSYPIRYGEDALFYDGAGAIWMALIPSIPAGGTTGFPRPAAARCAADGSLRDTVFVPARYAELCPLLSEWQYWAGIWEDKREQWFPKVKWAVGADGRSAFGCPSRFELDVLRPGQPLLRISKPWQPAATTADERAFYEQWWQPLPPLPESRPAYARIILPPDGRTWVWPEQPSEQRPYNEDSQRITGRTYGWHPGESGVFEVFEPDGEWLGSVRLPEAVKYSGYPTTDAVVIRGDTMWAVYQDSLDVQYIGRFEIRWPNK
ncbi:MAG: NHL repeat-containing protein [Longimicrobiales bacterium]